MTAVALVLLEELVRGLAPGAAATGQGVTDRVQELEIVDGTKGDQPPVRTFFRPTIQGLDHSRLHVLRRGTGFPAHFAPPPVTPDEPTSA